jgi:hypothetical protein
MASAATFSFMLTSSSDCSFLALQRLESSLKSYWRNFSKRAT